MKKTPSILRSSIVAFSAVTLATPSMFAVLNDTFDPGGPLATSTTLGAAPGPSVILDGTNNILHLLAGLDSQNNHYTYDLTDVGTFETINARFDFRITPGDGGLADGFGFILIPTSAFGTTGDGPNPTAEEPNVAGAFAVGVDVYNQINNISTHWNGFQVNELNTNYTTSFRDNGVFNRLELTLQRVGNATNATVSMITDSLGAVPGPTVKVMETVIPNMLPYENRVHFGGRTGGENMNLDLDNVNVTYATPFVGGLPVAPAGHLYQDFDSAGTTSYRAVQASNSDATVFRPGPLIKASEAGTSGAFLRVVNDNVAGQNNRIVFDRAIDSGASNMGESLRFDVRFNSTDAPADGMGLLFLRTRDPLSEAANFAGDGIGSSEEPNHTNMLGIGFDVFSNGASDPAPSVSLHWSGTRLLEVPIPAELAIGQFHRIEVLREPVPGGINVTVSATPNINGAPGAPTTLIDHHFVAGATAVNYDYRAQFSARTGGLNSDVDIDNVISAQIARPLMANTQANFTETAGSGSGWKGYAFAGGAAPDVRNDGALNGNFLRLTHDSVNGQVNAIAFDKQLDGTVGTKTGISGELKFRMSSPTDQPADGLSIMLIPTATFGNTGPGAAATAGFVAEEPSVPGVFGIGLDIYEGSLANQISIHWDGGIVNQLDINPGDINLTSGGFHKLQLELTQDAGGMLLDLILTSDIFGFPGAPVVVADNMLIPNMTMYDYRVELAARTGGLNMTVDLDDILFQTVPEPGSVAMLGLGALLLARRRRRASK